MPSMNDFKNLMQDVFKDEYENIKIGAEFAARLLKARLDKNLTQAELAKRAGLRQSAIARIENQGTLPRIDTVYKIAKALDMEFDFITINRENNFANQEIIGIISALTDEIRSLKQEVHDLKVSIHPEKKSAISYSSFFIEQYKTSSSKVNRKNYNIQIKPNDNKYNVSRSLTQ